MARRSAALVSLLGFFLGSVAPAVAQDYPTRPIRLIIPFAPGGSVDIVARIVASKLGERLGQQVTPDNRPGAGGLVATELAAKAPPDGHTLLIFTFAHAVNPWIYKVPYDPLKAIVPVASFGNGASVLTVHPSVPANSVKELIALAKAKPGEYSFAHAGVGSFTHTASVLFAMMADINVIQVPFKGGGPAMIDVMGGHTKLLMNSYVASVPHIRTGKLKPLGVSDLKRTALLPNVPTIDESGVPGYQSANWWGVGAPAGTPQPIIDKINREVNAVLDSEEIKAQFAKDGAVIVPMSSAEFGKFFVSEYEKWGLVVKQAGMKAE